MVHRSRAPPLSMRRAFVVCCYLAMANVSTAMVCGFHVTEPVTIRPPGITNSFVGRSHFPFLVEGSGIGAMPSKRGPASRLRALVYGPDGTLIEEEDLDNEEVYGMENSGTYDWTRKFEQLFDNSSLWIRLACGFARPPHDKLHPSRILSARLVEVNTDELSIALGLEASEGDGALVQVLASVTLPSILSSLLQAANGVDDDGLDVEIRRVVEDLDDQAQKKIESKEKKQSQEGIEEQASQARLTQELSEEASGDELPDWWTFPELQITLADECKSLKSLLNEADFLPDLQALCYHSLASTDSSSTIQILQASVGAVGPSGLFLRAQVQSTNRDSGKASTKVLPVSIAFPNEAKTSDDLRDAVLDSVEFVDPMPEPAEATPIVQDEVAVEDEAPITVVTEPEAVTSSASGKPLTADEIRKAREQPKSPEEEARLQAKYAAIEDVGERAFAILEDLGMI